MTAENPGINDIFGCTNDFTTQELIQQAYAKLEPAIDVIKEESESQGGYTEYLKTDGIIEKMNNYLSPAHHAPFVEYFNRISFHTNGDNNVVVPLSFCTGKLEGFDLFVGYVVNEDELDTEHLEEHEEISGDIAVEFMKKHNEWLLANKDIFDVFIENKTLEEAKEIIKNL